MTKYYDIFEEAIDNYGIITSARAAELGITNKELVQYAKRGRLVRVGQGVYQLTQRQTERNDPYALGVAIAGPDAMLYGESVIAMLELAPTNLDRFYVATTKRTRRKLPKSYELVTRSDLIPTFYEGIPSQNVADAIKACIGKMMPERLIQATQKAREEGYIKSQEFNELLEELS